ncbi:zinc finger protein, putative [Plasmodium berghei]|uniref:Zinc finger protein, putative n=2 Tax=Plasmodium berghei TaxID=5821 RepID=A0A509AG02_PLABA|nr:zinc finger protein, putative [Plasmodium berghei ANKA]CXI20104.1 zinc finger protein, putative [Plasmodium berghei]SCM19912.1 zinc finger protein, putative [Plasmodium berghei]SCN23626.1 zinc finger protein, putative [Plasmodium berghei]SCO59184.1 zinc finger protein, putative [Plasmodium berghei]SCO59996.1 zinc finger protein, putative [Plasmodium berghei]|eukprot:XP_034420698.1 zinc finger protein, putative [Plasmodium berghei ANKA]
MFYLIVYSQDNIKNVKQCLSIFENIYIYNGNRVEKINYKNCTDNKEIENNFLIKEKESIQYKYIQYLNKNKIEYYASSFIELYVNNTENFDLYLIKGNEQNTITNKKEGTSHYLKNYTNFEDVRIKEKKGNTPKNGRNTKKVNSEKQTNVEINKLTIIENQNHQNELNIPLHRSHMLFILSLPSYFIFYDFFSLIFDYIDYIDKIKIFYVKTNFDVFTKKSNQIKQASFNHENASSDNLGKNCENQNGNGNAQFEKLGEQKSRSSKSKIQKDMFKSISNDIYNQKNKESYILTNQKLKFESNAQSDSTLNSITNSSVELYDFFSIQTKNMFIKNNTNIDCQNNSINYDCINFVQNDQGINNKLKKNKKKEKSVKKIRQKNEEHTKDNNPDNISKEKKIQFYKNLYKIFKKKLKKKKIYKTYSLLILFKTQIYADMFYKNFHCKNIDLLIKKNISKRNINNYPVYKSWNIYCLFVSVVYYILDQNYEHDQLKISYQASEEKNSEQNNITNIKILQNNESQQMLSKMNANSMNTPSEQNNQTDITNKSNTLIILNKKQSENNDANEIKPTKIIHPINIFDINNYEQFFKNVIIDGNICISTCIFCMERLGNFIYYILTRNKRSDKELYNTNKYYTSDNYINMSCNACMFIIFYDIVSEYTTNYFSYVIDDVSKKSLSPQRNENVNDSKKNEKIYLYNQGMNKIIQLNELVKILKCKNCNHVDDLWLCLICSNIGCGRYQKSHAKIHSSNFNHNYCINLKTKKIWSYHDDSFIEDTIDAQIINNNNENITDFSINNIFEKYSPNNQNNRHSYHTSIVKTIIDENENENNNKIIKNIKYDKTESESEHMHTHIYNENEYLRDDVENLKYDTLYEYNDEIYDKIFDIFTNDTYIDDNLKNELLYILYSKLSYESNIYNNTLIDLQYKYLNKLEQKKIYIKNIQEKINEIKKQNNQITNYIHHIDHLIKTKNSEKIQMQKKIDFYRELNNNIIAQKKNDKNINQSNNGNKNHNQPNKIDENDQDTDSKKIKHLDQTIESLQSQIDKLLLDL